MDKIVALSGTGAIAAGAILLTLFKKIKSRLRKTILRRGGGEIEIKD